MKEKGPVEVNHPGLPAYAASIGIASLIDSLNGFRSVHKGSPTGKTGRARSRTRATLTHCDPDRAADLERDLGRRSCSNGAATRAKALRGKAEYLYPS